MITKELIDKCSIFNVSKVIAELSKTNETDFSELLERYTKLINELRNDENYWICDDEKFCFVGYKKENQKIPEVILTDWDKLEANGFDINAVTSFDWFWGNFLGLAVCSKSIEEYGTDLLVGDILYHITYYDHTEKEIAPLRKNIEKMKTVSKMSQVEFYKELFSEVLRWEKSKTS